MNKKKYKTGDVLKIPRKYTNEVDNLFLQMNSFDEMLEKFAVKYQLTRLKVWKLIHAIFPGTEDFRCSYDKKDKTIILTSTEDGEMSDIEVYLALQRVLNEKTFQDLKNKKDKK